MLLAFTLSISVPDEDTQEMINQKKANLSTDEIRKYILRVVHEDLEKDKAKI